jgi:NADH-quinone oxidoreductase subunit G
VAEKYNMVKDGWNGFNLLHTAAARTGALELGFTGGNLDGILQADIVYLLGADEVPLSKIGFNSFVIYQGHHGDKAASRADVILPGSAYTEKNAVYVNVEGRAQVAKQAVFPPGDAREDWKIIRALSEAAGKPLPYDNLAQVRQRLVKENPLFATPDTVQAAAWKPFGKDGKCDKTPFLPTVDDFYMTDAISRASKTMKACSESFAHAGGEKAVAHG